ncbi:MAG: methyltetrahydrofolate--corrinoid methyltransferase [Chloroflexi bacterium]|nr:MAG: methyltetrahydrofolate--corrinoid methyltransferase [Anaerolineaceae bacterium 4572_32.1]RLC79906.1 MAG: methyltetrahydrofolate--corrinoid methyltransferase [Chloroflexota bacterium]RLC86138.1 MAG: methyltetrahydrofolate--corrinoid methyltransferase [Chloroflexota bacterium]HEY74258.1 methyltetrahydrofolate cobalamin methyltransferase [Thermoflexia bacterium]
MKIIGEKINGTRKRVAKAITERDVGFIQDLARKQADAGADWLDVNAGTRPSQEPDDLVWLIEMVQAVTDVPLCLDSANPKALSVAIKAVERTPMINSISGEPKRLEGILPLAAEHDCPVVALAMDDNGIPETVEERVNIVRRVMAETRRSGLPDDKVYVDPLAMTIATNVQSGMVACDAIRAIHEAYPDMHFTIGLSNISFGLPARSYINRTFLTLALAAGLDCAIIDPLDREMRAALVTAELVLGRDRHCLNYTRSYRAGLFDQDK